MLELKNISKTFSGVKALDDVSFQLRAGEVHAVCGENGAGKSTLMNIIAGNLQPDAGSLILGGQAIVFKNHHDAETKGIAIVYQERSLVHSLSVAENIFLNHYPLNRFGFIDYEALYEKASRVLRSLQLDVSPNDMVSELSPAQEQMVEIAKALVREPRILILDEPTASITEKETSVLFEAIRNLASRGVGIIYISHRLSEIFKIANSVTVLKDGKTEGTFPIDDVGHDKLITLMVGRALGKHSFGNHALAISTLEVKDLGGRGFTNVSFHVKKGEIVALAGLIGAGRTEIAKTIFGALPKSSGSIRLVDSECNFRTTADAVRAGVAYLAEDRKQQSIFPDMSVSENIMAAKYAGAGFKRNITAEEARSTASAFKETLRIVTPSLQKPIRQLSGGNQQKAVLGRWLSINPRLLIVDEPTRGVDVSAKFEIYELLHRLAGQGTSVLLISSEMPEVLTLANRIIVICQGRVAGELNKEDATEETILGLASKFHQTPIND